MPRKETIIGLLGLLISFGLIVFALLYRDELAGIADIAGYSLLGIFVVSLVASSAISFTFIPIPYYLPVFLLPNALASEWGLLAPVLVGITSAAGASLGQLPTFMVGYGGKRISEKLASKINERLYHRALDWVKRHGSFAVFVVAAIPNPLHQYITLALGTLKLPLAKWLILTFLGNIVKNLAIAFTGYFALNYFTR